MNDDEVTRLMEVPLNVRQQSFRGSERARRDVAQTPCVGVSSMGNTHFGETRFGAEPAPHVRSQPPPSAPENRAPADHLNERSSTVPAMRRRRAQQVAVGILQMFESSRSLSLLLGLFVGVAAALLVVFAGSSEKTAPVVAVSPPVSLRVIARELGGEAHESVRGISSVAVRAGHEVIVTDDDGVAEFRGIKHDAPLFVEATCPEGYSGGRLSRTLTPGVLRSSRSWSLELVCEPEFVQVDIVVKAEGCGEMNVLIDQVAAGVTQGGHFRTSSRTFGEAAIELQVAPVSGVCDLDAVRTVALTRDKPVVEVHFQGQRPKPRRIRQNTRANPPRPYRL